MVMVNNKWQCKKGAIMSGQKINDHKFFAGGMTKDSVLPKGVHVKNYTSVEGAGEVSKYEDTDEAIKMGQEAGVKKIKGHPMKQPDYRN